MRNKIVEFRLEYDFYRRLIRLIESAEIYIGECLNHRTEKIIGYAFSLSRILLSFFYLTLYYWNYHLFWYIAKYFWSVFVERAFNRMKSWLNKMTSKPGLNQGILVLLLLVSVFMWLYESCEKYSHQNQSRGLLMRGLKLVVLKFNSRSMLVNPSFILTCFLDCLILITASS